MTEKKVESKTTQTAPGASPAAGVEASPAEQGFAAPLVAGEGTATVRLAHPWVDGAGTTHFPGEEVDVDVDTAEGLRAAGFVATG
jgi:hypothetical protein